IASIMRTEVEAFQSPDFYRATSEEMITGFRNSLTYFGLYQIEETKKVVKHHVEACSFPNWVGQTQIRKYHFSGTLLTLTSSYIDGSMQELTWIQIRS